MFGAMMGGGSTPPPKPPVPTACINREDPQTWCGREYNSAREFVFTDASYAIRHYSQSKFLRACPECVAKCMSKGIGGRMDPAPMATRSEENDK
jgi:hypothetical protein